ncbi:hypothetical protein ACFP1Z_11075 [Streptomyces gamaensis]|uniref:Tyrosine specific protein phosphatases domain-containing protein n=1 Tax=Streptomyces gamaensis TaxID=1763542 RepID=A0ABW0Z2V0_9ACTN
MGTATIRRRAGGALAVLALVIAGATACGGTADESDPVADGKGAEAVTSGVTSRPAQLVVDVADAAGLPKRFRTSAEKPGAPRGDGKLPDLTGLDGLRAAGSAAPSAQGLVAVAHRLPGRTVDVDLRQETHLFVNGMGVSWFGRDNNANLDLGHAAVLTAEDKAKALLAHESSITFADIPKKSVRQDGPVRDPKRVQSEEETARAAGLGYLRLTVPDHHRPQDEEVDRFVAFVRKQSPDTWLYFHCRGGKGRTTTFMAMYDMMRNAQRVGYEDILRRQQLLGGTDLLGADDTEGGQALARKEFLRSFHAYARTNTDGFATPYSTWVAHGGA